MPLYDFICIDGHKFTELVKFSERNGQHCPSCGEAASFIPPAPKIDYLRMGLDPTGNPTAGDKWAHIQEQKNRSQPSGQ